MNKDQVEGKWEQFKGEIKKTWGKLTDDEIAYYNGNRQKFLGAVQEKYGVAKEAAEKSLAELETNCGCAAPQNKSSAA
ncbi:MAG TPA: CsbD family protein [Rickettsiales bacterium]|nr:CsbD family protein [Rickettsiales bacterium]